MKTYVILSCILVLSVFLSAAEEAGQYTRRSVTHMNTLWLMDNSVQQLSAAQVNMVLSAVKKEIAIPRFDFNPIPEPLKREFIAEANRSLVGFDGDEDEAMNAISEVMNKTVVPAVVEVVKTESEMRAKNLRTEQERNSFITNKARELGITAEHIEEVMNSAYLYIPFAMNYTQHTDGTRYRETIDLGIIWWQITTTEDTAFAEVVHKDVRRSMGNGRVGNRYSVNDQRLNHQEYAFHSMAENGARNLGVATREIEDFVLSGQVISGNPMRMTFNLGDEEGLTVDDTYLIIRDIIHADGSRESRRAGWGIVKNVGDSLGDRGYQSRAQVISGNPRIGSVVREYPRLPIDVSFGYRYFPYSAEAEGARDFSVDGGHGFEARASYNIGRHAGISQLYFDFGFAMGWGGADGVINFPRHGTHEVNFVENHSFDFALMKKFYIRRLGLVFTGGATNSTIRSGTPSHTFRIEDLFYDRLAVENSQWGGFASAGVELALSPALNLGVKGQYLFMNETDRWDYVGERNDDWHYLGSYRDATVDHSDGISIQGYFTWSPPSLPFDPISWIRGNM
ncbi:hypothetical protein [Chitinivibrio alkaliphilus]|uniref:Uncharacterized protein n=1 Tax=Chitinivibrio alkaliphilus ACht1 TaxID=1313304 RepID=U7DBY6_9BACT|nr:hypothetical protein [Chitinivibrio alkaliphilus]ERP31920.1 hypothetical protein CALK_1138 [Chitinivibrio alkaliphilus ACht1]